MIRYMPRREADKSCLIEDKAAIRFGPWMRGAVIRLPRAAAVNPRLLPVFAP